MIQEAGTADSIRLHLLRLGHTAAVVRIAEVVHTVAAAAAAVRTDLAADTLLVDRTEAVDRTVLVAAVAVHSLEVLGHTCSAVRMCSADRTSMVDHTEVGLAVAAVFVHSLVAAAGVDRIRAAVEVDHRSQDLAWNRCYIVAVLERSWKSGVQNLVG